MGDLFGLLAGFDPTCVLGTFGAVAVLGFVAILKEWIVLPSVHRRVVAESDHWRDIAVPTLQMSGNLAAAIKNET